ncbi:MAG: SOS response-associated peptidase [Proteobacteria bacterium]|nr:SOS response-associated peptidase [Pseudomonadota bacterium]
MCGRYLLLSPAEAMRRLFLLVGGMPNFPARYNVAPTDTMPVMRMTSTGDRELALLRWGLVPSWADGLAVGSRMINARGETVATKSAFRESFAQRRCLVPADGYYEWKVVDGKRQPYLIRPSNGALMAFAAIWDAWTRPLDVQTGSPRDVGPAGQVIETYSIVTGPALPSVANTHDRMPVVLDPENFDAWLDPHAGPGDLARLVVPSHVDLTVIAVSPSVNSVKNDDAGCLDPVDSVEPVEPRQASLF